MRSWKSAVKTVVRETAASTWSSPSTSRRICMPRSWIESPISLPSHLRYWLKVIQYRPRELLGLLDVCQVSCLGDDYELRARDRVADELPMLGWCCGVVSAGDHERGSTDGVQPIPQVSVPDRLAAARVPLRRCLPQHTPGPLEGIRVICAERRGEPTLQHRVGDGADTVLPNRLGTLLPCLGGQELGRSAAQHETLDTLRGLACKPHADHPSNGEATEGDALDPESVQEREDVPPEVFNPVRTGWHRRPPVTAVIVAQ